MDNRINLVHEEEWELGEENVIWMFNDGKGSVGDGDIRTIDSPSHGALATVVLRMSGDTKSVDCEMNARLIKNAPAMHNLLVDILDLLEDSDFKDTRGGIYDRTTEFLIEIQGR